MDTMSTISRPHGWSAVLHAPLPGAGVLAVELLHQGELVDFVHEPDDVDGLARAILPLIDGHHVHRVHAPRAVPRLDAAG
jgi:hypothetical protein